MSSEENDHESELKSPLAGSSDTQNYLSTYFCRQRQPYSFTTIQTSESKQHVELIPSDTQNYLSTYFCRQRQPYSFTTIQTSESKQHVEPIPSGCSSNIGDQEPIRSGGSSDIDDLEPIPSGCSRDTDNLEPIPSGWSSDMGDLESIPSGYSSDIGDLEPILSGCSSDIGNLEPIPSGCSSNIGDMEPIPSGCSSNIGNQTQSGVSHSVASPAQTSPKSPRPSLPSKNLTPSKSTLSPILSSATDSKGKETIAYVEKETAPIYKIPESIEELIKDGTIPEVLNQQLSPSNYKDFFAALLYAEDFYIEKYKDYELKNVELVLQKAEIHKKSYDKMFFDEYDEKEEKIFVAFKITANREERPFLLSRDFVFAKPLHGNFEPYEGIISRVQKSNLVLAEFGDDFHARHRPNSRYNISFSFNRVCLKRAHQAVEAVWDITFQNFLFPEWKPREDVVDEQSCDFFNDNLNQEQKWATCQILSLRSPPPYLVEGPPLETASVVQEAVCQIYKNSNTSRILICAPTNRRCDKVMRSLNEYIPESSMFRANAAFREIEDVPGDILPSCRYERECFVCPPLDELVEYRVISSTYMSSFRLHNEGITAGHFTHVFLLDASCAIEPEVIVPLVNLADENTVVVVTGEHGVHPHWVRSDISRAGGLKISYFERVCEWFPYSDNDPMFITELGNDEQEFDDDSTNYMGATAWLL